MIFLLLSLSAPLLLLVYFYSKWKLSYWKTRKVPQLDTEFFYGNCRDMLKGDSSLAETCLDFYRKFREQGAKYGGVYIMFRPVFIPISREVIKDIMLKDFEFFSGRISPNANLPKGITRKNLFELAGEEWRWTRKHLTPTFTSGKMKMMYETLWEKTAGLEKMIDQYWRTNEPVNIKEIFDRFTIEVIGSVGFGIDAKAIDDPNSEFILYGKYLNDPPKERATLVNLFLRALGYRKQRDQIRVAENFFKNMVEENIAYREKHKISRKDFVHLMIQLKNLGKVTDDQEIFTKLESVTAKFGIEEITAQILVFFVAGYETSATTMSFAILELAQHPEMQEKIREELKEVLSKYDGKLTYDAVMDLKYTGQVIEETLRKYPPLSVIPRTCTKNYKIPGTESIIESGTGVLIPTWGVQMDPEHFLDPEKFDPERFSPENKKNIPEYAYIPFGEGPRMCLGLRFGMMQTKVGLATLMRNYNFSLNKKTPMPFKMVRDSFFTMIDGGVWVDVQKVEN